MQVFNKFLQDNFQRICDHALQLSSMGPFMDGHAIEYISFLKESFKHRLHSLLWSHQEKMAAYAASTRTNVSARHPFHQLNTLLAQLGAPNYRRKRTSYTMNRRCTHVNTPCVNVCYICVCMYGLAIGECHSVFGMYIQCTVLLDGSITNAHMYADACTVCMPLVKIQKGDGYST